MRLVLVPEDLREFTGHRLGFVMVVLMLVRGLDVHLLDVDGFGAIWVTHSCTLLRFLAKWHAVVHFDVISGLFLSPALFFAGSSRDVLLVELAVHLFAGDSLLLGKG